MVFQYYRAVPLWIPLKWNALLLIINGTMATALYLERRRADEMGPDLERLYEQGWFRKRGFSRVEFCRLLSQSRPRQLREGDVIAREGKPNDAL